MLIQLANKAGSQLKTSCFSYICLKSRIYCFNIILEVNVPPLCMLTERKLEWHNKVEQLNKKKTSQLTASQMCCRFFILMCNVLKISDICQT